ncbi:transposable element Tcb2 transposase [Trichonephila clavipes]|nr:transposable element Tcb2 transposase [Trichonephila clavipes]
MAVDDGRFLICIVTFRFLGLVGKNLPFRPKAPKRKINRKRDEPVTVFSDESRFNLWDPDGRIRVRRCLPECVVERHCGLTPAVMKDNARPHVAKTVRDFCSTQYMQFVPWPAYSPDMSPIEHMLDLVGWRLVRYPRPTASKDERLLRLQAIWSFSSTSRRSKFV